jgi:hypothetical protein
MTLVDIVIDTNILAHAANPGEQDLFDEASEFLENFVATPTLLCLDPGLDFDIARNKSRIFGEYLTTLSPATLANSVIASIFTTGRYVERPRQVSDSVRKKINRQIAVDKAADKVFVSVTYNSEEKILASHDYKDFSATVRATLLNELGVAIAGAKACRTLLCRT